VPLSNTFKNISVPLKAAIGCIPIAKLTQGMSLAMIKNF